MTVARWLTTSIFFLCCFLASPAKAADYPATTGGTSPAGPLLPAANCDPDGTQASGAVYRICMPAAWNGDLIVYAHGYVSPTRPVGIPEEQMVLPDGTPLADVVTLLGFAFATTSYSSNGLAIRQGVADLVDLVDIFSAAKGTPNRTYLIGISEGGLITALAVEGHPDLFDGGLALCGPYGDFRGQIDHFGDLRVIFDYFFPGLLPPSPVDIPPTLLDDWDTTYQTAIKPALDDPANAGLVKQLLDVSGVAYDPAAPETPEQSIKGVLWYNVFATNDARLKLNGQPFDNRDRLYRGSADDAALNQAVQRFTAGQIALDEIAVAYQTSGVLGVPLVTMHTTGDPIVPHWQARAYRSKTIAADNIARHEQITIDRYGHCTFTAAEVLSAFDRLTALVAEPPPYRPAQRVYLPLVGAAP